MENSHKNCPPLHKSEWFQSNLSSAVFGHSLTTPSRGWEPNTLKALMDWLSFPGVTHRTTACWPIRVLYSSMVAFSFLYQQKNSPNFISVNIIYIVFLKVEREGRETERREEKKNKRLSCISFISLLEIAS